VRTTVAWRWRYALISSLTLATAALLVAGGSALASYKPRRKHAIPRRHQHVHLSGAPYHALLLEDADTGKVLYDYNGGLDWPPASMAKMMLLLVAEDQIRTGRIHLTDPVIISPNAASTRGSHIGLRAGQIIPLAELMKAALIRSANDAAVAVAEEACGSTEHCVELMNQRARNLGMTHTTYGTVDGLPPTPLHDVDTTNAYDLATLARALIHQTDLLEWSGMETASFDEGLAILHNTNHLIGHFEGCDGLKTGFTLRAGFNLTATAKRADMRLVAVVLGAPSNNQRFVQAAKLLGWGFDNYEKVVVIKEGEVLPVRVSVGSESVQPVAQREVSVIVPKKDSGAIKMDYAVPTSLFGPLTPNQTVGQVIIRSGGEVLGTVDAVYPSAGGQPHTTTISATNPPAAANTTSATVAPAVVAAPASAAVGSQVAAPPAPLAPPMTAPQAAPTRVAGGVAGAPNQVAVPVR
jgi:serine-type D-Ala-D-Ala carboxypeptidase (penicillin-binding protein 5/6)